MAVCTKRAIHGDRLPARHTTTVSYCAASVTGRYTTSGRPFLRASEDGTNATA